MSLTRMALGLVIALLAAPLQADPLSEPMTFSFHRPCLGNASFCGDYILAQGVIIADTPQRFSTFLSKVKYKPSIYFHSPGGDLGSAIKMGYMIRKARLDTFVGGPYEEEIAIHGPTKTLTKTIVDNGVCFSACTYAFLGGVTREINDAGRYGVHQFSGSQKDSGEDAAQVTTAVLANYLDDMGIDRRLLDIASVTHASDIQVIPLKLARTLNIDNTDPPKSEWELNADDNGRLVLSTMQRQAKRAAVTGFIIMRDGDSMVGALRYEVHQNFRSAGAMDNIFVERTHLTFEANNRRFELRTPTGWRRVKNDTYTVTFPLPSYILKAIADATTFQVVADWAPSFIDVNPSTEFGTVGFRNGLAALENR